MSGNVVVGWTTWPEFAMVLYYIACPYEIESLSLKVEGQI